MGGAPKVAAPRGPTPEELEQQRLAAEATAAAEKRAADEKLKLERNQQNEAQALAAGLRGRRSLLSTAGEAGFSTGLGGV